MSGQIKIGDVIRPPKWGRYKGIRPVYRDKDLIAFLCMPTVGTNLHWELHPLVLADSDHKEFLDGCSVSKGDTTHVFEDLYTIDDVVLAVPAMLQRLASYFPTKAELMLRKANRLHLTPPALGLPEDVLTHEDLVIRGYGLRTLDRRADLTEIEREGLEWALNKIRREIDTSYLATVKNPSSPNDTTEDQAA